VALEASVLAHGELTGAAASRRGPARPPATQEARDMANPISHHESERH